MRVQKFVIVLTPGSVNCPGTVRVPAEDEASARRKIQANRCPERQHTSDLVHVGVEEREVWPS